MTKPYERTGDDMTSWTKKDWSDFAEDEAWDFLEELYDSWNNK